MNARFPLLPALLLACACVCPPPWTDPDACDHGGTLDVTVTPVGPAPWDGFFWRVDESICMLEESAIEATPPRIVDARGAEVAVAPFGLCERWGDPAGLLPGDYTFTGWADVPTGTLPGSLDLLLAEPPAFEVEPWGRDASFEAGDVAGGTWILPSSELTGCSLLPLLAQFVAPKGDLHLRLGEPQEGEVDFELLWGSNGTEEGAQDCRVFAARAALSATGELRWNSEHERWDEDPVVEGWDVSLHLGFAGSGVALAGGEARALLQTTGLSQFLLGEGEGRTVCELLGTCEACPDGSGATCMAMEAFGATGSRSERVFAENLPSCWELLHEGPDDTGDTGPHDTGDSGAAARR